MEILFRTNKLRLACNNAKEGDRLWGPQIAGKVRQRLEDLASFDNLEQVPHIPPFRCHELTGNRTGQFAVDLKHPFRLVFEPAHDPVPIRDGGGILLSKVTAIVVVSVEDYHGR